MEKEQRKKDKEAEKYGPSLLTVLTAHSGSSKSCERNSRRRRNTRRTRARCAQCSVCVDATYTFQAGASKEDDVWVEKVGCVFYMAFHI